MEKWVRFVTKCLLKGNMKTILLSEQCQMKPNMVGSQNAKMKMDFVEFFLSNAPLHYVSIPIKKMH